MSAPDATGLALAVEGSLTDLSEDERAILLERGDGSDEALTTTVADIVADVRQRGDDALRELAEKLDGVRLEELEVPQDACREALDGLDSAVRDALATAAEAIEAFHRAQLPQPLEVELRPGLRLGRAHEPLQRVGAYSPGGRAAYPSTVLMCAVPARVAGVGEIVVCSPPTRQGLPAASVLATCALLGVDRVFALGGAGAVAALAFGTESVPRVDAVVGPGNAYVAEAKRQLAGRVRIECVAGPSELLVVADDSADAALLALELIAQAEHDPAAAVCVVTPDASLLGRVREELARRVASTPRRDIVRRALAARGALLLAEDLQACLAFAAEYAPEHLLLATDNPRRHLRRVRAAGTVFLGDTSSVVFGDYVSGANHVLPTGRAARSQSGLSATDFLRSFSHQEILPGAARLLAPAAAVLARAEELPAHAEAVLARADRDGQDIEAGDAAREGVSPGDPTPDDLSPEDGAETMTPAPAKPSVAGRLPLRAAYREIELYDPGRLPVEVDLSDNTNRFGTAPAALRLLGRLGEEVLGRYPTVWGTPLKERLAEAFGVGPDNVATGCGSDDLLDSAVRAFCEPGDLLAFQEPTFSVVPTFARMNGVRPIAVSPGSDFTLREAALLDTAARVIYVCRPDNPSGALHERRALERLDREAAGVVLLDEAYADFCADPLSEWAATSERTVSFRTFSKAYGLAGLRVGFAVGPAPLIVEIEKSRGPYKVNAVAAALASAALEEDREWVAGIVERVREVRERLARELAELQLETWPSEANFLLMRAPSRLADAQGSAAAALTAALRQRGLGVRAFPDLPVAGDAVRVTVGPWEIMERLLAALREIVQ